MEILKMINKLTFNKSVIASGLLVLLTINTQAHAASACKGLDSGACDGANACSWVDGYTRKDGRSVKSFCRTKATNKKSNSSNSAKQSGKSKNSTK